MNNKLIETFQQYGLDPDLSKELSDTLVRNKVLQNEFSHGWDSKFEIKRYANEEDYQANRIYSDEEAIELFGVAQATEIKNPGNLLLNGGITVLLNLGTSTGSPTAWSNAAASIGVGDSSTAEVATQTNLQAATNKYYQGMDSTYPQVAAQTATWQITVASGNANFAWNEFTINNAVAGSGVSLCRKASNQGTKIVGQIWTIIYTVTLS